ncbi:MAG: hypothetical protein M0R03_22805 [Novosphingobium sp.]|jgi:hypothetical protein|nr:hypothetical protein [Novosphingobium sp.]
MELTKKEIQNFAKNMSAEDLALMFETRCNSFNMEFRQGKEVGKALQRAHRTLQATAFRYLIGIIAGLSEQTFTDMRNNTAIQSAKKIAKMVENDEIEIGHMI